MKKKPIEIISRGEVGEVLAAPHLPPALAVLARDWEKLTYDEKVADAKQRPLADCVQMLQALGRTFKNAIQLVWEFRPLIEACRDELSQPGRRVPVEGKPTWTEFLTSTFGFSARRIQQLLADSNPSTKLPKPPMRPTKAKSATDSNDVQTKQVMSLAVKLANSVVEHGLGDQFPEADAILNIFGTTRKAFPLKTSGSTESLLVPVVQDSNEALLPAPETRADDAAEQPVADDRMFQLLPDCYVCGTGINFCAVHRPEHM